MPKISQKGLTRARATEPFPDRGVAAPPSVFLSPAPDLRDRRGLAGFQLLQVLLPGGPQVCHIAVQELPQCAALGRFGCGLGGRFRGASLALRRCPLPIAMSAQIADGTAVKLPPTTGLLSRLRERHAVASRFV